MRAPIPEDLQGLYERFQNHDIEGLDATYLAAFSWGLIERTAQLTAERDEFNAGWKSCIADLQKAGEICKATEARLAEAQEEIRQLRLSLPGTSELYVPKAAYLAKEAKLVEANAELAAKVHQCEGLAKQVHDFGESNIRLMEHAGFEQAKRIIVEAENAELRATIERLSADVNPEEDHLWAQELTAENTWAFSKGSIHNLLAARLALPTPQAAKEGE